MARFGVGQSARRKEDDTLLKGGGRFQDDIALEGEVHACFVRSPHAHADIRAVETAAAAATPGVLAVYTGADVAADGLGTLPCVADAFIALKRPDGSPACYPPNPMLAEGRVRHVGEAVAMVVAESQAAARDAADLVSVDYAALPAVVDAAEAREPGATRIWPEAPGNLSCVWAQGDADATEAAFGAAPHVVEIELVNNRVVVNTIEPRGALGVYDAESERYTLYINSQRVHGARAVIAGILGIGEERLRVLSYDLGGGFGMKYFTYPEQVLVAWAARRLGHPVRWLCGRQEGFLSDTQARDHLTRAALALDDDGGFLGLRVRTLANLGAYVSNLGPISPTLLYTRMLANAYRLPAIHAEVEGVLTNTVFTDAYRGAGIPESNYVVERLVDKAAARLGLAPDEIRRRNLIPAAAMPYPVPLLDITYDSGDYARLLEDSMALAGWSGFAARRAEAEARGRLRGIGMAVYVESTVGDPAEHVSIRFQDDGGVNLSSGTGASGQGHETTYAQLLSESLGIPFEAVRLIEGDSDDLPAGGGSGGSRSTYMVALAIEDGAAKVVEKGTRARRQPARGRARRHPLRRGHLRHRRHRPRHRHHDAGGAGEGPGQPARGHGAGARRGRPHRDLRGHLPQRLPHLRGGGRPRDRDGGDRGLRRRQRLRPRGQPDAGGRPGPRRRGAGAGPGGVRELRLRRGVGAASLRLVHGLLPAARRRPARLRC